MGPYGEGATAVTAKLRLRAEDHLAVGATMCWLLIGILGLIGRHAAHRGWGITILCLITALQIWHCRRSHDRRRMRFWTVTVLLQAGLTYAPVFFLSADSVGGAGLLAASLLLFLAPPWRWAGWAAVIASPLLIVAIGREPLSLGVYFLLGSVLSSLGIFGLTRLTDLAGRLRAARTDLVGLAVARERERVTGDLHHLLGYRLTAIVSQGERARVAAAGGDARQVRAELAPLLVSSRQALDDVRATAQRYRVRPGPR
ncbi:histidine kinase [Hamadaea tsunoensis]|uniref:histidine kinase n=1 Tax=Hamadaea tsunoensis TaxID=53368 RepID=UPI000425A3C1|nr:histidine kinase dimerization/phosphoacceptor domain-containing protein [Hamadaea tsunoensis]